MKEKCFNGFKGIIREDSNGQYITNSLSPFKDGTKIFYISDLNGYEIIIKRTWDETRKFLEE